LHWPGKVVVLAASSHAGVALGIHQKRSFQMKLIAKALVSAAALAALSAHAEGPYVGGSVGSSHYKGPDVGGLSTDRSSTGGKLYGGYGFTPNIAVEAGYADLGKASSAAGDSKTHGLYVDLVGTVPITQSLSALGRVGAFNGKNTTLGSSESSTKPKVGAGLQYDFNKQMGVRGEWERYRFKAAGSNTDADLYTVGVNYKF
jgi:OOP family OmpA-OmpF porin